MLNLRGVCKQAIWFLGIALAGVSLPVALPTAAWAQYASVAANLTDLSGSFGKNAYLHFDLQNCGANLPWVAGNNFAIAHTVYDFRPDPATGVITGQVIGNDQISCGNVYSSFYNVSIMRDAEDSVSPSPIPYRISANSTWTPGAQPMANPPDAPGFVYIFGNPTASQQIVQPTQGSGAAVSLTVTNGQLSSCTVTSAGAGYSTPPDLIPIGGNGTGGLVYAAVANGMVTSCSVILPGTGYTSTPSVTVVGGTSLEFFGVLDLSHADIICPAVGPCPGGGGAGGGGVGPGTTNQIAKFTSPTTVGNSSGGPDDGTHAVPWPNGLSVESKDVELSCTNGPAGTVAALLVEPDGSQNCQTASLSSNKAVGVAVTGAGATGSVRYAGFGYAPCIFDNQTVAGDYVVASSTAQGQCHDVGAATVGGVETVGSIKSLNSGPGTAAIIQVGPLNINAPGAAGGSGTVGASGCANGVAYYPGIGTVIGADCSFLTDGFGHVQSKSLRLTDPTFAGNHDDVQGPLPVLADGHAIYHFAPTSVATTYGIQDSATAGSNGQCWQVTGTATDPISGNTVDQMGFGACGAAGTEVKVNNVDTSAQTPINFQNSSTITFSNTSAGNIQASILGSTSIPNPSAPTLANQNAAGARSITYVVVADEDSFGPGTFHTDPSASATIANANASPQVKLTAYGDTMFNVRCFDVYVTADSGARTGVPGLIAACAGKSFIDTGANGNGVAPPSVGSNNTILRWACIGSSLPGVRSAEGWPCGVDAQPATPNALDDELTETFGAPGDANNPFWTWGNQQGATAVWSNGTIILTTDTLAQAEYLILNSALPGTPYTFLSWLSSLVPVGAPSNQDCFIGLRESSTGKMVTFSISYNEGVSSVTAAGGWILFMRNWTNNTTVGTNVFSTYTPNAGYLKLQNTGTTLNLFFSDAGNGVGFSKYFNEAVTTGFTTAPNQLIIGGGALSNQSQTCTFDFVRRTQ